MGLFRRKEAPVVTVTSPHLLLNNSIITINGKEYTVKIIIRSTSFTIGRLSLWFRLKRWCRNRPKTFLLRIKKILTDWYWDR